MGVGAIKRLSAVRWGVTRRILYAWLFTLPGAAIISTAIYLIMGLFL
jgi:PiT family inorganic phosphate transporter